jgi:hypothetical protein
MSPDAYIAMCLYLLSISKLMDLLLTGLITGRLANSLTECSAFAKAKSESFCQIKLRSLQSIRLSISTDDGCAFGPRKASKVEKPSSRGVSYLHRWSLMLLPVLWLMPLCALCTHVCVSTTLCLLSFASLPHCCSFPELGPMTQTSRPYCCYTLII